MPSDETLEERQAEESLRRLDALETLIADGGSPLTPSQIVAALKDEWVAIRAEILDYIIEEKLNDTWLSSSLFDLLEDEVEVQCIGRLLILNAMWDGAPDFSWRTGHLDSVDIKYLSVWSAVADCIRQRTDAAVVRCASYLLDSEIGVVELATNLMSHLLMGEAEVAEMKARLEQGARSALARRQD